MHTVKIRCFTFSTVSVSLTDLQRFGWAEERCVWCVFHNVNSLGVANKRIGITWVLSAHISSDYNFVKVVVTKTVDDAFKPTEFCA